MDEQRFDGITRVLASGLPRRSVLKALAGAVFGGAAIVAVQADADAACKKYARTCTASADCCTGLVCGASGKCGCDVGTQVCTVAGGITCIPTCPAGQYMGSGCRCLCLTTGRPPTFGDNCEACVGEGESCSEGTPCCDGLTCDGICFPFIIE